MKRYISFTKFMLTDKGNLLVPIMRFNPDWSYTECYDEDEGYPCAMFINPAGCFLRWVWQQEYSFLVDECEMPEAIFAMAKYVKGLPVRPKKSNWIYLGNMIEVADNARQFRVERLADNVRIPIGVREAAEAMGGIANLNTAMKLRLGVSVCRALGYTFRKRDPRRRK